MKKIKKVIALLMLGICSAFSLTTPINAATSATANFSGNSSVAVGSNIDVVLVINESGSSNADPNRPEGIAGIQGPLTFDTSKLELVKTTAHNLNVSYSGGKIIGMANNAEQYLLGSKNVMTFTFKALSAGSTNISLNLDVADADGNNIYSNTLTKTITITDAVTPPPVTPSSDATLKSLSASGYTLSPSFNPNTTSYTVTVGADATSIRLDGAVNDSGATVTGLGNITLTGDSTVATIKVTAKDGSSKTYTVTIKKEKPTQNEPEEKDDDATLKSLDVSGYTLSPQFNKNTTTYSMKVSNNITALKVNAIPNSESAKVSISGNSNWKVGNNVITIKVTAENGSVNIYTVNVERAGSSSSSTPKPTQSSDNYLKELTINSTHKIEPTFNKDSSVYNVTVPYEVDKLNLSAITSDSNAKVVVNGNSNFVVGKINTVEVQVTAENGAVRSYILNVTRSAMSSDASLEDIIINDGKLTPSFNPDTLDYQIKVDGDVDKLDIQAIAKNSDSKVEIIGNEDLKEGNNVVRIRVTDKNGFSKTYIIEVEKEADTILGLTPGKFWTLVGILALTALLTGLAYLLLRKKSSTPAPTPAAPVAEKDSNAQTPTPIIEFKPEFNFSSKNSSDDDEVHGNYTQDSEIELLSQETPKTPIREANYEEVPYDPFDETITKDELIDAIHEATSTKDPAKLKMLLEQDALNKKKKELKRKEKQRNK